MLAGNADLNIEIRGPGAERMDQGTELDGLGTGAENEENTLHQPSVTRGRSARGEEEAAEGVEDDGGAEEQ